MSDLHIQAPAGRPVVRPAEMRAAVTATRVKPVFQDPSKRYAYRQIPKHTTDIIDPPLTAAAPLAGSYVPGAIYDPNGNGAGIPASVGRLPPPPAEGKPQTMAQPIAAAKPTAPIRVGGSVQAARIIQRVAVVYPALARQARVSGTVELLGVIGTDGTVQRLQVISGHPLLVRAALDAVRQWIYRPTLLNGSPVEVMAPIEVRFTLTQ